jgi:hypothetical protein
MNRHIPILDDLGNCMGYVPQRGSNASTVVYGSPLHHQLAASRNSVENPPATPDTRKRKEAILAKRKRRLGRL